MKRRHFIGRFITGKSAAHAILLTIFSNFAIQALNIGTGILTARTLGPSGRGALAAVIMWPQLLAFVCTLGLPAASVFLIRRKPDQRSPLVATALVLSFIAGLIGSVIGFFIIPHSLHTYPPSVIRYAQFAVFLAPISLLGVTLGGQVQAAGKFAFYNIFRFFMPLSIFTVLVFEFAFHRLDVSYAALAYLLAGVPTTMWSFIWVWQRYRPTLKGAAHVYRPLLSYGLRAWGTDLLGTISSQVDRVLVVGLLPPEAMGLYVVSQAAAGVLNAIPSGVVPVIMPKAADQTAEGNIALTASATRLTGLVMCGAALPLFLFGNYLLRLVYGPKFLDAGPVFRYLVVEAIFDGLTSVLSQAFLAAGQPGVVTLVQACGLLTAIPLLSWLIPLFGIKGAGIALMLSTICRFTFVVASIPLRLKFKIPNLLFGREEIRLIAQRLLQRSQPEL